MDIKTIPLSRLEANLRETLNECADSRRAIVIELPDHRLIAICPLEGDEDDQLVGELLESNTEFRDIVARSKASPRRPFPARSEA